MRLLLLSIGVSQLLLALTFIPALNPDTSQTTVYPQPFDADVRIGGVTLTGMNILTAILVPRAGRRAWRCSCGTRCTASRSGRRPTTPTRRGCAGSRWPASAP